MGRQRQFGYSGGTARDMARFKFALAGHVRIELPEHLSPSTRLVLGLFSMGFRTPEKMADEIGLRALDPPEGLSKIHLRTIKRRNRQALKGRAVFLPYASAVLEHESGIIRECIRWGLPIACGTFLPPGVEITCPSCGAAINFVPCGNCGRKMLCDMEDEFEEPDFPLREPEQPTDAEPGSAEKIAVMRARLARGESAFHPLDRVRRVDKITWLESMAEPEYYPAAPICDILSHSGAAGSKEAA